jgi:NTE family protein
MRIGLVLGAGGVVGMSYHAGVLHALEEDAGLDPTSADLIVGTSAGSVVGTLLRTGWTGRDIWDHALAPQEETSFVSRSESPARRARRLVGSTYIATRSMVKVPLPRVPGFVARRFPAGVFTNADLRAQLCEVVPEAWPEDPLWLVAVDVNTGQRVVLRRRGSTGATLQEAVLSSCAIPGVFPPVAVGRRLLVDGGAHSTTHLDLAATWGCDLILGVVPMAFDPKSAPGAVRQLVRRVPARAVAREARFARARGAEVLLVRPTSADLAVHGRDMMRPSDTALIARTAYEQTARLLDTPRFRSILGGASSGASTDAAA